LISAGKYRLTKFSGFGFELKLQKAIFLDGKREKLEREIKVF